MILFRSHPCDPDDVSTWTASGAHFTISLPGLYLTSYWGFVQVVIWFRRSFDPTGWVVDLAVRCFAETLALPHERAQLICSRLSVVLTPKVRIFKYMKLLLSNPDPLRFLMRRYLQLGVADKSHSFCITKLVLHWGAIDEDRIFARRYELVAAAF